MQGNNALEVEILIRIKGHNIIDINSSIILIFLMTFIHMQSELQAKTKEVTSEVHDAVKVSDV